MSSRHPSTPPPLEDESANPFFTTPQVKTGSSKNVYQHQRKNSTSSSSGKGKSSIKHNNNNNAMLFTPQTPCLNTNDDDYPSNLLPMSPQTTTKKNNPVIDIFSKQQRTLHMNNPLRTPETTPRHFYNKRKEMTFNEESNSKLGHPLFNTTPSTVGSGRRNKRSNSAMSSSSRKNSDTKNLLEFRSSIKIQVEEDEDVEMKDDASQCSSVARTHVDFVNSDYENEKEKILMNYTSSESDSDEERQDSTNLIRRKLNIVSNNSDEDLTMKGPVTPPMQIMDDDFIMKKFGVERCKFDRFHNDDEELEEVRRDLKNRKEFPNPFLAGNDDNIQTQSEALNPRYANEIEMMYHATGEKFYVELSEEGKKIQPKRLNFDEFRSIDVGKKIDLLQTPPLSSNRKMSIRGLLNYESSDERYADDDEVEIEREGVRHEKIKNPFRGDFPMKSDELITESNDRIDDKGKMEFLNQTTGKHIVEDMDEEQLRIKPKRLDFSGC